MSEVKFWGKYMAVVYDNNDPKMKGRIRVKCPQIYGDSISDWALPCFTSHSFFVPEEGDLVWIEFENGDPDFPIWTGWIPKGAGNNTQAPFQETHTELKDKSGNIIDTDKLEHETNEMDNFEHKKYHGHPLYYTPHRYGFKTPQGHIIELNDDLSTGYIKVYSKDGHEIILQEDESGHGYIRIKDTKGQIILIDTVNDKIQISGNTTIEITANEVKISGANKTTVESPTIELNGDVTVNGNLHATGQITDVDGDVHSH